MPERRVGQLQTGHADRLHLFHAEPVPITKARLFERLLHRDIGHLRSFGEWFDLNVEHAIAHIRYTIIQYDAVDDLAEKIRRHRI